MSAFPDLGGAERSLLDTVDALAARGFDVEVLNLVDRPGALAQALLERGRVVHVARVGRFRDPRGAVRAVAWFRRHGHEFDVVLANDTRGALYTSVGAALARVPYVWHVRDIVDRGSRLGRLALRLRPRIWIANSQAVAASLVRHGCDSARVVVVHNGVDVDRFQPTAARETVRRELGVDESTLLVGAIGRLVPWKALETLLEAAAHRDAGVPSARYLVVGDVVTDPANRPAALRYRESLLHLRDRLQLGARVHFLGERADVPRILAALDVFVHTAIDEPFGRVLIEAMAAGKPVVATRGGGVGEIVEDGVTGYLVPPRDAAAVADRIARLADDQQRSAMGQAGRQRALTHFSLDAYGNALAAVLGRVLTPAAALEPVPGRQPDGAVSPRRPRRSTPSGPRVAIVADYLNQRGGAEWVVAILHTMFPEAPVFTPILDRASLWPQLVDADIRVSWMQRLPGLRRHFRKYFALYPLAVEGFDLSSYDLVLSSSCAFGKGARAAPHAVHVCYCHTPMRFAWDYEAYIAREAVGRIARSLLPPLIRYMRQWDVRTSARPHAYVANSTTVARRIRRHYGRDATVIPPPVDVRRFSLAARTEPYYLVVSRLQAYKRIDLAVEAFTQLGLPLRIVGDGPDRPALERRAGPSVSFLGRVSDREVARMMAECQALVTPGLEDFGIASVEVNAAGRPVLAFRGGGALDIVVERLNGLTFAEATAEALAAAVEQHRHLRWDARAIREHAEGFDVTVFRRRMLDFIGDIPGVSLDVRAPSRAAS